MSRPFAVFILSLPACFYSYEPPPPPQPREATTAQASAGQVWDAVIDLFATRLIPIRTIERVSGLIATEGLGVDSADGSAWADCGRRRGRRLPATDAIYNVLVRGDSATASVRATVRWSHRGEHVRVPECTSTYVWERGLEQEVKARAEDQQRRADQQTALGPNALPAAIPERHFGSSPDELRAQRRDSLPPAPRKRRELLRFEEFRRAVEDVQRLGIITTFDEMSPDTLTVELGEAAGTSPSTAYNLGRLYTGYRTTTGYRVTSYLELRRGGQRVGEYSRAGLTWR